MKAGKPSSGTVDGRRKRLNNLRSSVATLAPRIAYTKDPSASDRRIMAPPIWKRWYHTQRWRDLRITVLLRDGLTCQMCKRLQPNTSKLVADHKRAHRGDPALFWDQANIQTLCADPCHNSLKQREEARQPAGVWD